MVYDGEKYKSSNKFFEEDDEKEELFKDLFFCCAFEMIFTFVVSKTLGTLYSSVIDFNIDVSINKIIFKKTRKTLLFVKIGLL